MQFVIGSKLFNNNIVYHPERRQYYQNCPLMSLGQSLVPCVLEREANASKRERSSVVNSTIYFFMSASLPKKGSIHLYRQETAYDIIH